VLHRCSSSHLAASLGYGVDAEDLKTLKQILTLLLQSGCDETLTDELGRTAFDIFVSVDVEKEKSRSHEGLEYCEIDFEWPTTLADDTEELMLTFKKVENRTRALEWESIKKGE
jgi:hypothetical protein